MQRLRQKSGHRVGGAAAKAGSAFARLTARLEPRPFKTIAGVGAILVVYLVLALPAAAQVDIEGLRVGLSGNVYTGYAGNLSDQGGSSHGLALGGTGYLQGSYYNPNFLSYSLQPYYNRSQSNSDAGSIFNSSGYTGNINLFSGSHFPGSVNFSQAFDSTGLYGIPDTTGLTTKDSSRSFGIGWGILLPDLPFVSFGFSRGSSTSTVPGSAAQSDGASTTFSVNSGYRIAGFNLNGGFAHQILDSNSSGFQENGEVQTANTSTNTYQFNVTRNIPLHGSFGLGVGRTDYSDSFGGQTRGSSNGTTDNVFGNVGILLGKVPINATAAYTSNLYGSFEQQQLSTGQPQVFTNLSPESRSLLVNVGSSYRVLPHVFVTGFVSRQEYYLGGQSYGLTQFGANVNSNFGKKIKGLTWTLGMVDSANRQGNQGAGLVANVNYTRNIGHWELGGNFNYNQNVQTMLAIYTTSSMIYNARVQRRIIGGLIWNVGGGGGRTGFEQTAGNWSHSESVSSSLSWHRYSVAGNFSQSNGTSVLTPTGLVAVPVPIISNNLVVFSGKSHGFTFGAAPLRAMSVSVSYNKANSSTVGQSLLPGSLSSNNETELINGYFQYHFRKMNFNAGVTQFRQNISASGAPPSMVTSYFFGISRWFKAF